MNILFLGLSVGTLGKVVLGIAVLRVHSGIVHEHKIDSTVIASMKREKYVTLLGLLLIVTGYLLEMIFYGYLTTFFGDAFVGECIGQGCSAANVFFGL